MTFLFIILAVFVVLAVLAVSYGSDSRDTIHTKGEQLGGAGVTWADPSREAEDQRLAEELQAAHKRA